jgi:hypothetical protein
MSILQTGFKFLTCFILALVLYIVVQVAYCYRDQHMTKPSELTDMPVFSEIFWIPFASAVVVNGGKHLITFFSRPIFLKIVKDQHDPELKEGRIVKASTLTFKFVFYTISSIWGYILFNETEVMPPWLGGSGSIKNLFNKFPYAP